MTTMNRIRSKYSLKYPNYLPSGKKIWVIQQGELMEKDGKVYEVVQVVRSSIPGARPKIVLRLIDDNTEPKTRNL